MPQAEKLKHISEDQHGGRNGRGAVDIVLGKVFKYETFNSQRSNVACTDCDTKACYDHIIPLVLLLTYVILGLSYVTATYLTSILYCLQYTMSTSYGLSEHTNWFDRIAQVFRIGQGASNGPPGWRAIKDIVLKVYAKLAKECTIKQIQH
eukprot:440235-Ditylum_brightwellii.AAC.1